MNCTYCNEVVSAHATVLSPGGETTSYRFCNMDCMRAWLGPDRPLTRRVEQAQNGGLSPQHIVVEASEAVRRRIDPTGKLIKSVGAPAVLKGQ